jgi:putative ABC transport system permease protein
MPERDFDRWTALVQRHAASPGQTLPADVIDELACYCADLYAEARRRGESAAAAHDLVAGALARSPFDDLMRRTRARRVIPSRLDTRTASRAGRWWADAVFDLRYALRGMRRNVAFTIAVVSIVGVGIGATTAAFTVIDAVLLRALPYPRPGDLVVLKKVTSAEGETRALSTADWRDYAVQNTESLALAAHASWPMNLTGGGEPVRLRSIIVSGNFFDVIGERPLLGRVATGADDAPSAPGVVVLSYGFWNHRFGRNPAAVGSPVTINGRAATVVGVMPPQFALPSDEVDLWMPMGLAPEVLADRASEWVSVIGRLRPGISVAAAQAKLSLTAASLARQFPRTNRDERVAVRPLLDTLVGDVRRPLWLGGAAVLFVLLAGCANAANLLLARATTRRDEIALRAALGADPGRLARQLLVESLALAGAGGAIGIAAASIFLRAFVVLGAGRLPRVEAAHIDSIAILVSIVASLATAVLFGGGAAWLVARAKVSQSSRADLQRAISSPRVGGFLLAGQVAFALMLAAGALFVGRAYVATSRIDPGFEVSDTVTMQLTLPRTRYPNSAAHARFADRVLEQVATAPGVASAGIVSDLPLVGNQLTFAVFTDGDAVDRARESRVTVRPADPGYFRTLRIPLDSGRYFEPGDRSGGAPVAIVNRAAAEMLWRGAAMNRRVRVTDDVPREVVGIVGDIKHAGLHANEGPVIYVPYAQKSLDFVNWMGIVVRGTDVSASVVKAAIARVDPNQPVHAVMAMDEYVARERAPYRFGALVVFSLAGAGFILAVTGVYGLTTFIVGRRFRELGVRLALGAAPSAVVVLVLQQILSMLVLGAVAGTAGSLLTTRLLQATMPPSSAATDPLVIAGALAILGVTSVAAALAPALRAARIDPRVALHSE